VTHSPSGANLALSEKAALRSTETKNLPSVLAG